MSLALILLMDYVHFLQQSPSQSPLFFLPSFLSSCFLSFFASHFFFSFFFPILPFQLLNTFSSLVISTLYCLQALNNQKIIGFSILELPPQTISYQSTLTHPPPSLTSPSAAFQNSYNFLQTASRTHTHTPTKIDSSQMSCQHLYECWEMFPESQISTATWNIFKWFRMIPLSKSDCLFILSSL